MKYRSCLVALAVAVMLWAMLGVVLVIALQGPDRRDDIRFELKADRTGVPPPSPPPDEDAPPPLNPLTQAYVLAQQRGQPLFVVEKPPACEGCDKLDAELKRPEALAELKRWTFLATDAKPADTDGFAFHLHDVEERPRPVLKILTPHGRQVARFVGYLPAAELVVWLKEHHAEAAGSADVAAKLVAAEVPAAEPINDFVAALGDRDPVLREMAARRLAAQPGVAAKPVAEVLAKGTLQARLTALDLLRGWGGPTDGLDPWRPETLTPERLKAVADWAANPPPPKKELTDADREWLREDLDRLTKATAAEAVAVRERLVKFGPAARAAVLQLLPKAETDAARERLLALRYRLAATDALVLRWPGGLDRLAATRVAARHEASNELARLAAAADEPLLLELFADPDPFVRELCLRTLARVSGKSATGALARLLDDPDPNVRAAVLKQLADSPSPQLVAKLGAYIGREKDLDLVVHAVKALRTARGNEAVEQLLALFVHDSWRVRAEAVESVGEILSNRGDSLDAALKMRVRKMIRERLADPDGFVVGRAAGVLKKISDKEDFEPMMKAADKHPELAPAVVAALDYSSNNRAAALPHLSRFCRHPQPAVRAAAVKAVCGQFGKELPAELLPALTDPHELVRVAAADSVFHHLNDTRPGRRRYGLPGEEKEEEPAAVRERMAKLFAPAVPHLDRMLTAGPDGERVAAARAVAALGRDKDAVPVLRAVVQANAALVERAAAALPWLPGDVRLDLARLFVSRKPGPDGVGEVFSELGRANDPQAADHLWQMAAREDVPVASAGRLAAALESHASDDPAAADARKAKLAADAERKADAGPVLQRLAAVVVLGRLDPPRAAAPAEKLAGTPDVGPARRDALTLAMMTGPLADGDRLAVAALADPDEVVRKQGLLHLCFRDTRSSLTLPTTGSWFYLSSSFRPGRSELVPRVPAGLDRGVLRRLLHDADPEVPPAAAYLLCVLGDAAALPPLVRYWREHPDEGGWTDKLALAVASLDDDANVPILEEVYEQLSADAERSGSKPQFRSLYWISRPLTGPNALRLRKRIRADVGMDALGSPE